MRRVTNAHAQQLKGDETSEKYETRSISSREAVRKRVTSKITKFQDGSQFLNIVGAIYGATNVIRVYR